MSAEQHNSVILPAKLPKLMRAARLHTTGELGAATPQLVVDQIPVPEPRRGQVLIEIGHCGVCHTELDEIEGRAQPSHLPIVPGHQVVGKVVAEGNGCQLGLLGQRVGVAWIHSSCGACSYCRTGRENLCPDFRACGKDHDGGYSEYMVVGENFAYPIPAGISALQAAPLLCAGAVGFRSLAMSALTDGACLGLTGFGSSGRLVLQMAKALHPQCQVFVFARNATERRLALEMGADWAGDTGDSAPNLCHAIIDTTPAWRPVLAALAQLAPGGRLIINAIRKEASDQALLAGLNYSRQLWMEKSIQSVANVTREDVRAMLRLAATHELRIDVEEYALQDAGKALQAIRAGDVRKSAVLNLDL